MRVVSLSAYKANTKNLHLKLFLAAAVCLHSFPAYAALENNLKADAVLGQANFNNSSLGIASNRLFGPQAIIAAGERIIVADQGNNRILIWNSFPAENGTPASVVLGQPNFDSTVANNGGRSSRSLSAPTGLCTDGRRLFVMDRSNNRVLVWDTIPNQSFAPADFVIGQPDFLSGNANQGAARAANTISGAERIGCTHAQLFIADVGNSRVLIFNISAIQNNMAASVVLGQSNFATATAGTSNQKFSVPFDVFSDGTKLFLGEGNAGFGNQRVLIWNRIPDQNFAPADVVVGQPDFGSTGVNQGGSIRANTFFAPEGVHSDGVRLFVADRDNNRILVWNKVPTSNNQPADTVIGQNDFSSGRANKGQGASDEGLNAPESIAFLGNRLLVSDSSNHRILIFNIASMASSELGPQFEQGKAVLGKVFEDKNSNGRQERDEKGIEGIKIASDTGIYAVTDEEGKYHFPFIQIGQRVLKIDESTLPEGSVITTESPRKVVVTKGILSKISFGVKYSESHPREGGDPESLDSRVRGNDKPLLKVSLSQDPSALAPRLSVSSRQEDDRVIFTIDCNYFLFVNRAELKLFDSKHNPFKTIELTPLPYEYEMPAAEFIANKLDEPKPFYYQLSVFNAQGSEDRTHLGEIVVV
jgi:hypothetical protein